MIVRWLYRSLNVGGRSPRSKRNSTASLPLLAGANRGHRRPQAAILRLEILLRPLTSSCVSVPNASWSSDCMCHLLLGPRARVEQCYGGSSCLRSSDASPGQKGTTLWSDAPAWPWQTADHDPRRQVRAAELTRGRMNHSVGVSPLRFRAAGDAPCINSSFTASLELARTAT